MHFSNYDLTAAKSTGRPVVLEGEIARLRSQPSFSPPPSKLTFWSRSVAWIQNLLLKITAKAEPDVLSTSGRA